jgi:hypothetical protein
VAVRKGEANPPRSRSSMLGQWALLGMVDYRLLTLQVGRLLLAKYGADFAHARGQRNLEVAGHDLLALVDAALLLALADHHLYALNGLLALLEAAGDGLRELFNLALLAFLDILVVEAREDVFLMQLVEVASLLGDVGEQLGNLVLDVEPARGQQVHLNDSVAVVVVGSARHEALALLGGAASVAKAIGAGAAIARLLLGVVRVRLAVGDEAVQATSARPRSGGSCQATYRLVRSRHMVGRRRQGAMS